MLTIGYSTRFPNPFYQEYLQKTCMYQKVQIIEKVNNGDKSLSEVYNEILDESENDIVVLLHDDLEFDTNKWGDKLLKVFEKNPDYGIIGLAGSKYISDSGKWWEVPQSMYGIVNHKHEGKKWSSNYSLDIGNKVEETIIVDGLFIAIDKTKIKHKFDETIPGFHFYDLGFCLPNFLDDVGIGVTFSVRVTHLSIGQTNQQWELNRKLFQTKYSENLPIDITDTEDICESFIFIHDQNLLLEYEEKNKFKDLKNYKYVFVGKSDTSLIKDKTNVIIAKNFDNNLEDYPMFTAFTGWYVLWKNNLIKTKYINLFEYDVNLVNNFEIIISKLLYEDTEMIGYVPMSVSNFQYINNTSWVEHIFSAYKKVYGNDLEKQLKNIFRVKPNSSWSSTSNITFRKEIFDEFMKWFEPMIPYLKDTKTCGHAFERAVSFYYFTKNKKITLTNGLLKHFQMNSHGTQPHVVDYEKTKEKLLTV